MIYVASVTSAGRKEHYTGLTSQTFKKRWSKHEGNFEKVAEKNDTTLSSHIWKLKEEGKNYDIKWEIMDRAPNFNPVSKKCRLCLKEVYYILFHPDSASLNSRNEVFNSCRHKKSKLLAKFKT